MCVFDFLFGDSPSQDVSATPTLTPEQQQLLQKLVGQLGAAEGDSSFGLTSSPLELQSLAGLESVAGQVIGSQEGAIQQGGQTASTGLDALSNIFTQGPQDIDNFFNETIQKPLLENFRDTILPSLQTRFAPQFFGGERIEAEGRARNDLIDALTRERARVGFEARDTDAQNVLGGLSVLPGATQSPFGAAGAATNVLGGLLGAGGQPRDVVGEQLNERNRRIIEALNALGISGSENIVFNNPGETGFLTNAVSAFAGSAGAGDFFTDLFGGGGGSF